MFENYITDLKNTSFDDAKDKYLVEVELDCINFDKYKYDYCKKIGNSGFLKSVDAVIKKGDKVYFIEFKNSRIDDKLIFEIKAKCYDSILMYFEKTNQTICESRKCFYFILVTNYGSEPEVVDSLNEIKSKISMKSSQWDKFVQVFQSFYFKLVTYKNPDSFNKFLDEEGLLD